MASRHPSGSAVTSSAPSRSNAEARRWMGHIVLQLRPGLLKHFRDHVWK